MKRCLTHFASAMRGALKGADATFTSVSTDTRSLKGGELFVALVGPNFDGHNFIAAATAAGAVGVVVSRSVETPIPQIMVDDTVLALQRAAGAWRTQFKIPVIAVAGSNGKTTTKELIANILAERGRCHSTKGTLNNHIGVPLTLLELDERHATAVIEIGANHPREVESLMPLVCPTVGIVTNAGAEHLEGFGDLDGVARAEGELFAGLERTATAVINVDDEYHNLWSGMARTEQRLSLGFSPTAEFRAIGASRLSSADGYQQEFDMLSPLGHIRVKLALIGRHNVVNALGAAAAAYAAGASNDDICAGLQKSRPIKGRIQSFAGVNGAQLIDDSYNANPSSLTAGLEVLAAMSGERWLVLGDMGELGEHSRAAHLTAGREARERGVTRLFAVGECTSDAVKVFGQGAEWFKDSDALASRVQGLLTPGVTVLVKGSRSNRLERVVEYLRVNSSANTTAAEVAH